MVLLSVHDHHQAIVVEVRYLFDVGMDLLSDRPHRALRIPIIVRQHLTDEISGGPEIRSGSFRMSAEYGERNPIERTVEVQLLPPIQHASDRTADEQSSPLLGHLVQIIVGNAIEHRNTSTIFGQNHLESFELYRHRHHFPLFEAFELGISSVYSSKL